MNLHRGFITHIHLNKCVCVYLWDFVLYSKEWLHVHLFNRDPVSFGLGLFLEVASILQQPFWTLKMSQALLNKFFSSDHRRGARLMLNDLFRFTCIFIVFLSKKFVLSVKLLIFPMTEMFHGDCCCYLHVYGENCNLWVIWEISTVSAVVI